jgi:hypothetical protein
MSATPLPRERTGTASFTLLDGERPVAPPATVEAQVAGASVRLLPDAMETAFRWHLAPEGLCREGLCVPLPRGMAASETGGLDLADLARALGRPLALDLDERVACLAASAGDRSEALASLEAPDFALADLAGRRHALSDYRGRKVLLVTWASW